MRGRTLNRLDLILHQELAQHTAVVPYRLGKQVYTSPLSQLRPGLRRHIECKRGVPGDSSTHRWHGVDTLLQSLNEVDQVPMLNHYALWLASRSRCIDNVCEVEGLDTHAASIQV